MDEAEDPGVEESEARRLIGQVISGRYRLEKLIGTGGMGAVFRAEHTRMRKPLAVKVLHPSLLAVPEVVERFEREALAGAHINHPNVAAAIDFGQLEDGSHFLVLELLQGEDLRVVLDRGKLAPDRAMRIARQVALALRATHELGIVHRDLKPENIMLIPEPHGDDAVKLLDFGIAKVPVKTLLHPRVLATPVALTKVGLLYGTVEYMAPEQALGDEIDGRADLYALGVVMYEMFCGVRPFDAETRASLLGLVATKKPPPMRERVPGTIVPKSLEEIVMRLLEKDASARYASAEDLLEAIEVAMLELDYPISTKPSRRGSRGSSTDEVGEAKAERSADPPRAIEEGAAAAPDSPPAPLDMAVGPRPSRRVFAIAAGVIVALLIVIWLGTPKSVPPATAVSGVASAAASESIVVASAASATSAPSAEPPSIAPEPPHAVEASAAVEDIDAARAKGLAAIAALALRFPNDPAVLKALMRAQAEHKGGQLAAVRVAKRLLQASPDAVTDEDVRAVLLKAAGGPPEISAAAFEVMSTCMGTHGPDLVYELITAPGVGKFTKERGGSVLEHPNVRELASPGLLIADDLRTATRCHTFKGFLPRAAKDGDVRALHYLLPLISKTNCASLSGRRGAPTDCNKCLGDRAELRAAIASIEEREEKLARPSEDPKTAR